MLLIELVLVVIALVLVVKGKVSSTCWVSVKEKLYELIKGNREPTPIQRGKK